MFYTLNLKLIIKNKNKYINSTIKILLIVENKSIIEKNLELGIYKIYLNKKIEINNLIKIINKEKEIKKYKEEIIKKLLIKNIFEIIKK